MKCAPINLCVFIAISAISLCSYLLLYQIADVEVANDCFAGIPGLSEEDVKGILRQVPDVRDYRCPRNFDVLTRHHIRVSIIITYHNETLATLLTTIYSIYRRTSLQYLQEIILIDDFSENDFTYLTLATQLRLNSCPPFNNHTLVRSVRNSQRMGLIKSRNMGAQLSRGNYIMFMDSHCEVNQQWLESLLATLLSAESDDRWAVSPLLDNIDVETREYKSTEATIKGGFDWNLHFHWIARDKILNPFTTFRSPTFAGGVFLISRNWFFKLKAFNTRLEIWGGESLEFSLKLWLCGGEIRIVPCSRMGHVFRRWHIFQFPQNDGQSIYLSNSKIIAETWLDHYKYNFYNLKPEALGITLNTSRTEIERFKRSLKCHNFEWYLTNVFPELRKLDNFTASGTLSAFDGTFSSVLSSKKCLHHDTNENDEHTVTVKNCLLPHITNWFLLRSSAQLQSQRGLCLSVKWLPRDFSFYVIVEKCSPYSLNQKWKRFGLQIQHSTTGLCLETTVDYQLSMNLCRRDATTQYFRFSQELEKM